MKRVALVMLLALAADAAEAESLLLEELGNGPVPVPGVGNAELSGITWAGGGRFLSVDDGRSRMFPLEVTLDDATGAIQRVEAGEYVKLEGARDSEGIAWRPNAGSVLVIDEASHQIREHDPVSGALKRTVATPARFQGRIRGNRGFEGITAAFDGQAWITTEGPIRDDGAAPTALAGAWVRLQRLDGNLAAAGQYAYRTEPGLGFVGVVDLLATPEGDLLVLERALTGGGFSARIFRVDLAGATDVTSYEKLRNRKDFRPVQKTKLWERAGGFQNFEGIALGPALAIGGRLVLLVSDGGGQRQPALLALRLTRKKP